MKFYIIGVAFNQVMQEAKKFHCGTSGYHQPFKCSEVKAVENMEQDKHDLSG